MRIPVTIIVIQDVSGDPVIVANPSITPTEEVIDTLKHALRTILSHHSEEMRLPDDMDRVTFSATIEAAAAAAAEGYKPLTPRDDIGSAGVDDHEH